MFRRARRNIGLTPERHIKAVNENRTAEPPRPISGEKGYRIPRQYAQHVRDHSADSQETKRARRRSHLTVEYGPEFVLSAEVAAVLAPLAERLAADPDRWAPRLRYALRRAPDETPYADRPTALTDVLAAIARVVRADAPELPEIDAAALRQRSWVESVAAAVRRLDAPLAAELAWPHRTVGDQPLSDWLVARLRELDGVVRRLAAAADRAAVTDAVPRPDAERRAVEALRARHAAERKALRARHAAEAAAFAAARKIKNVEVTR
ncbi:hypothetical protein CRM89_23755 [Nocardia sp. FDAARGOS_372]|uniref:hypothetical protein n=1 Tax=Nocardia sp. FDAARGOS_372 TaxID=2018066 RepID=UPI000BEF4EE2|nr:hypothetical protein [Nocardia sp. FDAARGOS_372]PEH78615.1 hypothetical protein CRM89_23755 [Nocardia sp. FDAARGOS_372]